jgi:site-specific recombinase XerD
MSRHTFATETCLSEGVSIEAVSRMMGHKNLNTTQIYAKVTHNKVNEEMKALGKRINEMYVLAS